MSRSPATVSLMLGNLATGLCIIGPTAMLPELARGLDVSVRTAGLLITFGAIMLCIGSPLSAWLTSRFDRRGLLTFATLVIAVSNFASAFAPSYEWLLGIRMAMLSVVALYTPQAAGVAAHLAVPEQRGRTISFVFMGWPMATAIGLPIVASVAGYLSWRWAYGFIGLVGLTSTAMLIWNLPRGIQGIPVNLGTWVALARNSQVRVLLLITAVQMSAQFMIITFIGPLLKIFTGARPEDIAIVFTIFGVAGFLGNVIASRIVDTFGAFKTSLLAVTMLLAGVTGWTLGTGLGAYLLIAAAMFIWGLGFASFNSMQQVRLAIAAPTATGASVSLNTSSLYIGHAVGSLIGGMFYVREMYMMHGIAAMVFMSTALLLVVSTRRAG